MTKTWWLVLMAVGCSQRVASSASEPIYDVAGSVSVTGATGSESVSCPDGGLVVDHGCVVNGGDVIDEVVDAGAFTCIGSVAIPVKGATIIAWAGCE